MKEIFKKNCSKFLIFVHMISLSPVYAMESVDGELDKQEMFDYLESSNSEIDLTDNIVDDDIERQEKENDDIDLNNGYILNENDFKDIDDAKGLEAYNDNESVSNSGIYDGSVDNIVQIDDDFNATEELALSSDNALGHIGFSTSYSCALLTEPFNPDKKDYIAIVKDNYTFFTFATSMYNYEEQISVRDSKARMNVYFNDDLIFENITRTQYRYFTLVKGITNVMKIVVTAENGEQATYTVTFEREGSKDTSLTDLGFKDNNPYLTEPLDSNKKDYVAIVKDNKKTISFNYGDETIRVKDGYALLNVYLNDKLICENKSVLAIGTFNLIDGITNKLLIEVTSENSNKSIYTVTFEREGYNDTSLKSLGFYSTNGGLTEPFVPDKKNYTALIKGTSNTFSFTDDSVKTNSDLSRMDIYFNDELIFDDVISTTNQSFTLVKGISNILRIVVTAENGEQSTYTVTFEREGCNNTLLDGIGFLYNNPILTEIFSPDKKDYVAIVKGTQTTIGFREWVKAEVISVRDPYATMNIYLNDELILENIVKTPTQNFDLKKGITNVLRIVVTAENGEQTTYTVTFEREGYSNSSLEIIGFLYNNPALTEVFNSDKKEYIAVVKGNQTTIGFRDWVKAETISVRDPYATMDIYLNDELILENIVKTPTQNFNLRKDDSNVLRIVVTAENGEQTTYTVTFEREGYNDSSLSVIGFEYNNPALTEVFSPDKKEYIAVVKGTQTTISFRDWVKDETISVSDPYATMNIYLNDELILENIVKTPTQNFDLKKGITNILRIVVTAENGEQSTYTVTFERELDFNTSINDFSMNKGSLDIVDDTYIATVDSWRDISISKLNLEDSWADYRLILNGEKEVAIDEKFDLGIGDNRLDIEVTSNNGTKKTYPVIFERSDKINPIVNSYTDSQDWTKEDVLINISASDDSGIRYIELPSGEKIYSDKTEFYVNQNGVYKFKIYDNFLNEAVQDVEINNIDKELPKLELKPSTTDLTNESVDIIIEASDNIGVKCVETPNGELITKDVLTYTVYEDGTYIFKVIDLAGNEVIKSITLNNIDSVKPTLTTELSNKDWSNEELILSISAMSDKGIKYIELPNGTRVEDSIAEYRISENGVYIVATESLGGNITTEKVVVSNIDMELPNINIFSSNEKLTNNNVLINIEGIDNVGVDYIVLPNGEKIYETSYNFEVKSNGMYEFTVVDLAGNRCTKNIEISNIDKELPTLILKPSTEDWTNKDITISILGDDNVGVDYIVLPNGEKIYESTYNYLVNSNGEYEFTVVDLVGNKYTKSIEINNIDKEVPVIENYEEVIKVSSDLITLDIFSILTPSGIYKIILPNGEEIINPTDNIITFRAFRNGVYRFIVIDNAGNSLDVDVSVNTIREDIKVESNVGKEDNESGLKNPNNIETLNVTNNLDSISNRDSNNLYEDVKENKVNDLSNNVDDSICDNDKQVDSTAAYRSVVMGGILFTAFIAVGYYMFVKKK